MSDFMEVKLVGDITRIVHKPTKYNDEGIKKQEEMLELLVRIPMIPTTRTKLPDIASLANMSQEKSLIITIGEIQGRLEERNVKSVEKSQNELLEVAS